MKVLAFSDVAWPEGSGGVERSLREIYPRLATRHGAEIWLVTLADSGLPRREHRDGVTILRTRRLPLERVTGAQVTISVDAWRAGLRAAQVFRPDLIHAHTLFYHTSLVAAVVARRAHRPLLLTLHLGAIDALPQPYRTATRLYERTVGRALLIAARRIICVSEDVRRHALALGATAHKLVMVPNGVDAARFAPRQHQARPVPTVVCVGRLIFNKGQQHLLEATADLRRRGISLRLLLVGDGPQEAELRRQAAAYHLDEQVTFLGRRDDVEAVLADADVFVRPSLSEGMSLAVLEAMACGLPVIATDVSGTRQLIRHGTDGIVVQPGSVPQLSEALERLLRDAPLRQRLGHNARQRALAYNWERVAEATAKEMKHACA